MKITFCGSTEEVTGSMTLVELTEGKLLVDCGLYQGVPETERKNKEDFPFDPAEIKAVILTHAHLDHCGLLPKLVNKGFKGAIFCTPATAKLAGIILEDSAGIEDQTLYDEADVRRTIDRFKTIPWHQSTALLGGTFTFLPAGHILGASSVRIKSEGKSVVFSGDVGRFNDPLIHPPERCPSTDIVIMESTYGGRNRSGDPEKELYSFLMKISRESRVGIIASFAVARGQLLITLIHEFFKRHPEEKIRVVIDSPMMREANRAYYEFSNLTKMELQIQEAIEKIEVIEHQRQWESLSKKTGPLVIISSSGMMTGGRISRHLMNWQDDERAVLFLPGYQGEGTPGRAFLNGDRVLESDHKRIVWKGEVIGSEAFSSHADQSELLTWIDELPNATPVYLIHGEESSKKALAEKLKKKGLKPQVPSRLETIGL